MHKKNQSNTASSLFLRVCLFAAISTALIWLIPGWLPASDVSLFTANPQVALAAGDPVVAAAGDISCDPLDPYYNSGNGNATRCRQKYTSDLLVNAGFTAVLDLGDNQYNCGGIQAYQSAYAPTWGRVKAITRPAVGNHEYLTSGTGTNCDTTNTAASGYFQYFGASAGDPTKGYYSYDLGAWHIVVLNTNCSNVGGCNATSPQAKWLEADLTAHPTNCTLVYYHIPLFSSGGRGNNNSRAFWTSLYNHNVDVVLTGHDHLYERFAPQTPDGVADPSRGIREFVVGTGGANHNTVTAVAANSQVINTDTFGVLKLNLHIGSYSWKFLPEAGKTFTDSGSTACH